MVKEDRIYIPNGSGIYLIESNKCDKVYVGSTINLKRRFIEHINDLTKNKHHNIKLQNYVNKYGIISLNFCIFINKDTNIKELRSLEKELIDDFDSYKNGFNCTDQVEECGKLSNKIKKIISEKAKLRQSLPEVKERLKIQNSGINNPNSKLREDDIKLIRSNTKSIDELALLFNVSKATINRVIAYKTYK